MKIGDIKKKAVGYFSLKPEVKVSYIFGSRAKGSEGSLSDIDIAILIDEEKAPKDAPYGYKANIITDLMGVFKTGKIDLVILNESPLFLSFRVIHDGIVLYSADENKRIDFEVKIMSRYFDEQYYFQRHARLTVNRIAAEGVL